MLRVKQIQTDYNMGDIFDITNYIEPDSNDARLEYDNSEFAPDKLGKYTIKYKDQTWKVKQDKKAVINVVDEVNPYIDGPDEIDVSMGTDINWSDYYNVTDEDPDVQDSLKSFSGCGHKQGENRNSDSHSGGLGRQQGVQTDHRKCTQE